MKPSTYLRAVIARILREARNPPPPPKPQGPEMLVPARAPWEKK